MCEFRDSSGCAFSGEKSVQELVSLYDICLLVYIILISITTFLVCFSVSVLTVLPALHLL